VRPGDVTVPYAAAQTAVMYGFLFVSIIETLVLAYLIPWAVLRSVTLVLDVWGVYFILALHASCVVRPHLIGADGSLRLRYGAAAVRGASRYPDPRRAHRLCPARAAVRRQQGGGNRHGARTAAEQT
jgi:hypothetical protein